MDQFLGDAKRLVHRLHNHDNAVDILIGEATNLQSKLIAMRQYHEEVNKMNDNANHRPRSTLILGSQLENQRIQNLEQENRELSLSLAEHQSALELIMNKYREQVLIMMKANGTGISINKPVTLSENEVAMKEKITEMAYIMRQSALIDENVATKEIEVLRSLQIENENLRELLEISGKKVSKPKYNFEKMYNNLSPDLIPSSSKSISDTKNINMKDSGIYENEPMSFVNLRMIHTKDNSKKLPRNSLDDIFSKANQDDYESDTSRQDIYITKEPSENYFVSTDPSENCFRAIISDIKPLEGDFEVNKDVVYDDEDIVYVNNSNTKISASPNQQIYQLDNSGSIHEDIPDVNSVVSEQHSSVVNDKVKLHFENMTSYSTNSNRSVISSKETNTLDDFEKVMMKNFVTIVKDEDNKISVENFKNIDSITSTTEDSVLEMLDNVLDIDDMDDEEDDLGDYVDDEVMENESSDEEDANDEFSFHMDDTIKNNNKEIKEINGSYRNDHIDKDINSGLFVNHNKKIEHFVLQDKETHIPNDLMNGEVSDTDSEVTITEDDVDEALAGFDTLLADVYDGKDNELD